MKLSGTPKPYTGRGVMKFYASGKDLAADMGLIVHVLAKTHDLHFEAAKKRLEQHQAQKRLF